MPFSPSAAVVAVFVPPVVAALVLALELAALEAVVVGVGGVAVRLGEAPVFPPPLAAGEDDLFLAVPFTGDPVLLAASAPAELGT